MHDDTPELGTTVLALGAGERWALDQVRRHGVAAFIAIMTVGAVVFSGSVVVVTLVLRGDFDDPDYWIPSLLLGTVVPAMLAPPLLLFSARLVARLDTASRLLQASSITDPLTGVANRRGFFAALDRLESDDEIEVAMVDLDSFKLLNDAHGHAAGDDALRAVASWLVDLVGDAGTVGRIGGDEFAFVAIADPFRITPSRQRFDLNHVSFTVSVGRAIGHAGDPQAALLAADAALYEQKQSRPVIRSEPRVRSDPSRHHEEP